MIILNDIVLEDLDNIVSSNVNWEKLKKTKILITGANGMIAQYIVFTLLYLNDTKNLDINILMLVRDKEKSIQKYGKILERKDIELIVQDVSLPLYYEGKINYIIHAASQVAPGQFLNDPIGTISANTLGTTNMLNLAEKNKVEGFLYLSTREVYGKPVQNKMFINEEDYGICNPTLVRSCYQESKRMSETLCSAYKHQYNVNCKIARIAHTYGPGMTLGDGRVIGDLVKDVVENKSITLKSDGSTLLEVTYISDLITGLFMHLLEFDEFICNISNDEAIISVRDLALKLINLFPERTTEVIYNIPYNNKNLGYLNHNVGLLDATKAKKLGFKCNVGIEQGFIRLIKSFIDK